jgi:predicted nucleotide-binding protein
MEKAKQQLEKLIKIGKNFTYENFSQKSLHGYPNALVPEWISWETRCRGIIEKLFGKGSAQFNAMQTALNTEVIGYDSDRFELKRNYIIGTLNNAIEILEEDIFNELQTKKAEAPGTLSNKVFVVHGHDEVSKTSLEIFLKEIGLEPVVLHRQADEGQTIIEKFEKHSDVGYAFILLTPDECAYLSSQKDLPEAERLIEYRARPNVIFEFGYFVGKLGRKRVCCLHKGSVSLPSDVSGMIYKGYNSSIEEAAYSIMKDLKAAGYKLS